MLTPELAGLSYLQLEGYVLVRPDDLAAFVQAKVDEAVRRTRAHYEQHERLLTSRELAEALGISENTVTNLVAGGQLQAVRVGTQLEVKAKLRFRRSQVEAYLTANTSNSTPSTLERLRLLAEGAGSDAEEPRRGVRQRKHYSIEDIHNMISKKGGDSGTNGNQTHGAA